VRRSPRLTLRGVRDTLHILDSDAQLRGVLPPLDTLPTSSTHCRRTVRIGSPNLTFPAHVM